MKRATARISGTIRFIVSLSAGASPVCNLSRGLCQSPSSPAAGWYHVCVTPLSVRPGRSEEHTSELQSLMRISYAVFCLKKKNTPYHHITNTDTNIQTCHIHK